MKNNHYDVAIVGSGFAASFFLFGFLKRPENRKKRIVIIEAGPFLPHHERLKTKNFIHKKAHRFYSTNNPDKPWFFSIAFGGGSNCWFGSTPRMLPEDFKIRSLYGVGNDWPISYDDIEKHYTEAERIMDISGGPMPYPMSSPYPLPPHKYSTVDRLLKQQYPDEFFHLPTARSSMTHLRAMCCNNGVCYLCPIDAKFTILNGMKDIFHHPQVDVFYDSIVTALEIKQQHVHSVEILKQGQRDKLTADLVVLGANAIFNPFILLKSGLNDGIVGRGICEQVGATIKATFTERENVQGSTITTGIGYNYARGSNRTNHAAFVYHTVNRATNVSFQRGKWLNQFEVIIAIEDLPQSENRIQIDPADEFRPIIQYKQHSSYAQSAYDKLETLMSQLLSPLAPMHIDPPSFRKTESHIQCTTMMGNDPKNSVVDAKCLHHSVRNLLVLGSGCFPTASPANPTLTLAALSLYAAEQL